MIYSNDLNNDGLGNQLFRFAYAYSLAIQNQDVFVFNWNKSKYIQNFDKEYMKKLKAEPRKDKFHLSKQLRFDYKPLEDLTYRNILLEGYYQSESYFIRFKDYILKAFRKVQPLDESCSVHVRRGDYLSIPNILPICTKEYYTKAINYIVSKYNITKFTFYSDDISWCVKNFISSKGISFCFVDLDEEQTFYNIQNHSCNIIANSTFSWWAAWLANHDKVVAPKTWFHPSYKDADDKLIVPERWIRL